MGKQVHSSVADTRRVHHFRGKPRLQRRVKRSRVGETIKKAAFSLVFHALVISSMLCCHGFLFLMKKCYIWV